MNSLLSIPLFPLDTVLFPGQLLPLHIFEPRYQLMIRECIAEDSVFGVVLIRQGFEVGESANPFLVGTTARIRQVDQLENGLIDLICVGEDRFQIQNILHQRPFLSGEIEFWPWQVLEDPEEAQQVELLGLQLATYLKTLTKLTGSTVQIGNLPEDPFKLTSLAAIALRISNREKQGLLATENLPELMHRCNLILRKENLTLKSIGAIPDPTISLSSFYYPN